MLCIVHKKNRLVAVVRLSPRDAKLGALVDELRTDLIEELNRLAYPLAYLEAVFGDAYARVYADARGVRDIYIDELVRPPLVHPTAVGTGQCDAARRILDPAPCHAHP